MQKKSDEARAFDERTLDRIKHGWVPDIKNALTNHHFYNNPWREPYLVQTIAYEHLNFAFEYLHPRSKTLDVGCGAGQYSLEMARAGYKVTGIDISEISIELAKKTAANEKNISLEYHVIDVMKANFAMNSFDNIVFFGTLHHFKNPDEVLKRVSAWLKPQGRIVTIEPGRDEYDRKTAAIVVLIRSLLCLCWAWYEPLQEKYSDLPEEVLITKCLAELKEATDEGEKEQSPDDNSCTRYDLESALNSNFKMLGFSQTNSFFDRIGGGIRGPSARETANFLAWWDKYAIENNIIVPGGFRFAGEKR